LATTIAHKLALALAKANLICREDRIAFGLFYISDDLNCSKCVANI